MAQAFCKYTISVSFQETFWSISAVRPKLSFVCRYSYDTCNNAVINATPRKVKIILSISFPGSDSPQHCTTIGKTEAVIFRGKPLKGRLFQDRAHSLVGLIVNSSRATRGPLLLGCFLDCTEGYQVKKMGASDVKMHQMGGFALALNDFKQT